MAKLARCALLVLGAVGPLFIVQRGASAQGAAPKLSAAFPSESPASGAPTAAAVAPDVAPAPPPLPAAPAPPDAHGSVEPSAPPDAPDDPREPPPPLPPPPPPQKPSEGFERPELSVRVDPFNFLLEGRLGLEIETQVYRFLTLELVPVFVTSHSPPTLNYATYERSSLRQSSNGIGAISGAALDAGLWFGGKPFNGYVFRAGFTNYAYSYDASYGVGGRDSVSHTDRQFFAMIGSHSRWGAFTIAGGIGLAYELNKQNRCLDDQESVVEIPCDKDSLQIKISQSGATADLLPSLYPFDLLARFSLGVVF